MSHVTQRVVSRDILQDSDTLSSDGNGEVGGVEVFRGVRAAVALELWVDITGVGAGYDGAFILESRLKNGSGWHELARISLNAAAIGTPPKAFASATMVRGEQALGEEVRGRYEVATGDVTASMYLIRRE